MTKYISVNWNSSKVRTTNTCENTGIIDYPYTLYKLDDCYAIGRMEKEFLLVSYYPSDLQIKELTNPYCK